MACLRDTEPPSALQWSRADEAFWRFLRPWLTKAVRAQANAGADPFPALIYTWVPFNAWLGQVIEDRRFVDRDRKLVETAAFDTHLCESFRRIHESDPRVAEFHALLPIFKSRALVDTGIAPWVRDGDQSRFQYVAECFSQGLSAGDWAPRCFQHHQGPGVSPSDYRAERMPADWLHSVQAIYQVRCNLFHGGKAFQSLSDRHLVHQAANILWATWRGSGAIPADVLAHAAGAL